MDDIEKKTQMKAIGDPKDAIPKFATNVAFQKLSNGSIIMTFFAAAHKDAPATLIETILVDERHAKKIVETLDGAIKKNDE